MSMTRYNSALWEQIELSESYLVSSMLEEATSLASLVIKQICGRDGGGETLEDLEEFYGMMESAGMVLVQSLSQLGRGPQILNQLKENFVSAEIPVEVFHTAVCIQISEGSLIVAQEFIEEFLNKCRYVDGKYYVGAEPELNVQKESNKRYILEIDQYMAIVETYALALLATALKKVDLAISWIEKAAMPAESKQELLRKLYSLYSLQASSLSQDSSISSENDLELKHSMTKELNVSEGSQKVLHNNFLRNGYDDREELILKSSWCTRSCFWWFHSFNLKFGTIQLVITNRKILLGCLVAFIIYILQKKRASLNRILKRQLLYGKKALTDLWQLAFSYQVNPLAVVQPLPPAPRGR